jgi:hypothetical protein
VANRWPWEWFAMFDLAQVLPAWSDLLAVHGPRRTSLSVEQVAGDPQRVRIAVGLDRPDLPPYSQAQPTALAKLATTPGLARVPMPLAGQGGVVDGVLYNAGRFTLQGVTINVHDADGPALRPRRAPREGARGMHPGASLGALGALTGSLCAPLRVNGRWTHLLSCAHVLAPRVMSVTGAPPTTYAPGPADAGGEDGLPTRVGQLERFLRGVSTTNDLLPDIAVARCDQPPPGPAFVPGAGYLRRVVEPHVDETVLLRGRRTQEAAGRIVSTICLVDVAGCTARHFMRAAYTSRAGDSGGLIYRVAPDGVVALGMHAGREDDFAYFVPLLRGLCELARHGVNVGTTPSSAPAPVYSLI